MNRKEQTSCGEAGFTLVELLVSIAILGLVSLILSRSLSFGFNAWERGTAYADHADDMMLAQDFIRRAIGEAYPLVPDGEPTRRRVVFEGTTTALSFLAQAPRALGGGGRSRMRLMVVPRDGSADLVLTSNLELASGASPPTSKVLLANAAAVEFAYFGKRRSDRAAAWHEQWAGELAQPHLVRVHITFPTGDTRLWPDLVIAPRIGFDVSCVYDPLTKRCRGR